MRQIAPFNALPPKPSYIRKVLGALRHEDKRLNQLIAETGLTKTQVGCTLEHLITEGEVNEIETKQGRIYGYQGTRTQSI